MSKKHKISDEHRTFNESWTDLYFFITNNGKLLCLICKKTILTVNEYNVKRHYETEHKLKFDTLTGDLGQIKIKYFKSSLTNQQNSFKLQHHQNESGVRASFVVAEMIANCNRPFNDTEFIKKCMLAVVNEICPEKKNNLKTSVSQLGPVLDVPKS